MNGNKFKLLLFLISISIISCNDKSTESTLSNTSKYEIVLSGWNGKMGKEDHIILLNMDGSFKQSVISWSDSCGKISNADLENIITQLNDINPFQIILLHNNVCTDADGGKQTTKIIITDTEKNKTNTIRWSDCENDEVNVELIEKLNTIRNNINNIIKNTEKHLCN